VTHDIYELKLPHHAEKAMEELREKLHTKAGLGVTLMGNRMTLRWGKSLRSVHMVILEVEDGRPEQRCPGCGAEAILEEDGMCNGDCRK
jgi:hypothetical protein